MKFELENKLQAIHLLEAAKAVYQLDPLKRVRDSVYVMARCAILVELLKSGERVQAIGEFLGLHYTSVIYHNKNHDDRMTFDKEYSTYYQKFSMLILRPLIKEENILNEMYFQVGKINKELKNVGYDDLKIEHIWSQIFLNDNKIII